MHIQETDMCALVTSEEFSTAKEDLSGKSVCELKGSEALTEYFAEKMCSFLNKIYTILKQVLSSPMESVFRR